ncbi:MAG: AtpZ/AtpI family protein [Terriglobia bacterium]
MPPPEPKGRSPWRQLGLVLGMGFTFVAAVALGLFVGLWLDGKLGTKPLFTLLLSGLGFAAGFRELLRELKGLDDR